VCAKTAMRLVSAASFPRPAGRSNLVRCTRRYKTVLAAPAARGWHRRARPLLALSFSLALLLLLLQRGLATPAAHGAHAMDGGGMSMQMSLYWGPHVTLWFDAWTTRTAGEYALALGGLAALCVLQEALLAWRLHLTLPAGDAGCAAPRRSKRIVATLALRRFARLACLQLISRSCLQRQERRHARRA
jgi:hypothetical protein